MRELSIFVDESGSDGLSDRHYLLTVVMHDQSDSIADSIEAYESALRAKGLPDIPQYEQSIVKGQVWPDPVFFGAWPYHLACFASSMDVSRPTRVFAV